MYLENDPELERCDEELRKNDDRRKKILERKNRRIRQIREKQLKDKEAWMKKLIPLLDKTMEDHLGSLYWYGCSVENVCAGLSRMEIPDVPAGEIASSVTEDADDNKHKQVSHPTQDDSPGSSPADGSMDT